MNKSHLISLLLLCGLVAGCANQRTTSACIDSAGSSKGHAFRFIVAADPQLFRGKKEDLDRAIRLINQQRPDLVVMCGDMVETSGNLQQIQAYKDSVSALSPDIPLYHLPGNHDLGLPVKKEKIETYREHFGPLWFHFTHSNSLFIVLSSDILADPNAPMHKEQMEWLAGALEQPRSETVDHVFVFMHQPLYLNTPDESDGYSNMPTAIRKRLLKLFVGHRVRAVFSGHLHDDRINNYKGVDLITTNSITVPMGQAPVGFRIIDAGHGSYEHTYCSVQSLDTQEKDPL